MLTWWLVAPQELPFDEEEPPVSCSFIKHSPAPGGNQEPISPGRILRHHPSAALLINTRRQDAAAADGSNRTLLPPPTPPPVAGGGDPETIWEGDPDGGDGSPRPEAAGRMLKPPPTPPLGLRSVGGDP